MSNIYVLGMQHAGNIVNPAPLVPVDEISAAHDFAAGTYGNADLLAISGGSFLVCVDIDNDPNSVENLSFLKDGGSHDIYPGGSTSLEARVDGSEKISAFTLVVPVGAKATVTWKAL